MSNYSLTLRLPGFTRAQIKRKLRSAFGSAAVQEAQITNTPHAAGLL